MNVTFVNQWPSDLDLVFRIKQSAGRIHSVTVIIIEPSGDEERSGLTNHSVSYPPFPFLRDVPAEYLDGAELVAVSRDAALEF